MKYEDDHHLTSTLNQAIEQRDRPLKYAQTNAANKRKAQAKREEPGEPVALYMVTPNSQVRFSKWTMDDDGVWLHGLSSHGWHLKLRVHPGPTPTEPPPALRPTRSKAQSGDDLTE